MQGADDYRGEKAGTIEGEEASSHKDDPRSRTSQLGWKTERKEEIGNKRGGLFGRSRERKCVKDRSRGGANAE